MSFTLKDIKGAVVSFSKSNFDDDINGEFSDGFEIAIDTQSSVRLRLNREKLARVLFQKTIAGGGQVLTWEEANQAIRKSYYEDADAIIAAEKELIEVSNET